MNAVNDLTEIENPKSIREFKDKIEIKNLCFSYDESREILTDINLTVPKGKMIALVGQSGSGKSTLVDLIPRYYDVNKGSISIDGVDIREMKIKELRGLIGNVNQEAILFNDTIEENIKYGSPNATHDEVVAAAKMANAHEFIMSQPEGYGRMAGEKGFALSGGERQRIAIARAILRNPPILILDEATSALDTVTEKLVQDALENLMKNRTVFAIAHRLSTIRNADLILVMDHGVIVERGTHDELYAKNGVYRKLCDMQATN
jgi:ATP-binding cassette subfamily B protein/subfamily B ATP-binding cassette protein MsbA